MRIFTFENCDKYIRSRSSAGGLFSALAENTINHGGVVYGVSFDPNWEPCHCRIDCASKIDKLRGSKYVFTNISKCFPLLSDDIAANRTILIVGTPCQIASVRKKFGDNDNLLLVEVVCHGAPDPKYWNIYLNELLASQQKTRADIVSISFRDKTNGWKNYSVRIDFKDGTRFIQSHRNNPYILAFIYDYTLKSGCSKCPFKYPNSKADISMGDFWGIESLAPEIDNNLGTTIAISNTSRGEDALSGIATPITLSVEDVARFNPAIINAPNTPSNILEFELAVDKEGFNTAVNKFLKFILDSRNKGISMRYRLYCLLRKIFAIFKKG